MVCRQCGTEIAEKAIICYKCGTATALPGSVRAGRPAVPRRRAMPAWVWTVIAAVVAGLVWWQLR